MSTCLSHAWIVSKRLNIIKILSLSDRIILLVFRHQGSLRNSDGFTAKAPITRGKGSDFQPMRLYLGNSNREAYLLWKANINSYVLYRIVPLLMTLSDPERQFQGHSIV